MLSRSATTIAVTSTSLGHASVTACTGAGSASWMSLITAKHRGTNADSIGRGTAETGAARPRARNDDEVSANAEQTKNESREVAGSKRNGQS